MNYNQVNDSGARENFETGSRRDTRIGKGRYDLMSVIALRRDAKHFENGAAKYGDRNWEKGQPCSRYLDSAMRHLLALLEGDHSEDHAAAVRWNVGAFMHTEEKAMNGELPFELLDLPWQQYKKVVAQHCADIEKAALFDPEYALSGQQYRKAVAQRRADIERAAVFDPHAFIGAVGDITEDAAPEQHEASEEFRDALTFLLRVHDMCGLDEEVLAFSIDVGSLEEHLAEQAAPVDANPMSLTAYHTADGTLCIVVPSGERYVRMVPQS